MCSMSVTVVVNCRSYTNAIREDISCAESPLNTITTATTGISMFGEDVHRGPETEKTPRIKIRIDATTNVYGRRSASRTIHISIAPTSQRAPMLFPENWARRAVLSHAQFQNLNP